MKLGQIKRLDEMPQLLPPMDFTLGHDADNIKRGTKLMRDKRKVALSSIGEFTLWEFPSEYALIRNSDNYVAYYMKFEINNWNYLDRRPCVSQIAVWRDVDITETKNIASKIFFDHLLFNWKTVMTDDRQTSDGEKFWRIRITDAFDRNIPIYFVSFVSPKEVIKVRDYNHLKELDNSDQIWGIERHYRDKRLVITTDPLQEKSEKSRQERLKLKGA